MNIPKQYAPNDIENKWYAFWMEKGYFRSEPDDREPYTIVIPPPNVTGVLHMGHMLNNTIQDLYTRRARQLGKAAVWVPGTDHAGIATQVMVERQLEKEGTSRLEVGRETFLERVWAWKEEHGGIIDKQHEALGASLDWSRYRFTMDEVSSRAVREAFCRLYDEGLIYRAYRLINWDWASQTALSDLEVEHQEVQGKLWHLAYPVEGTDEVAAVAASFNRAAERIEGLVAAHRSLLANASHELRSPLARLRMASDLNEAAPSEARRREIARNLSELDELVEEILLASRLDHAGAIELSDDVDLLALAAEEGARHGVEVAGEAVTVKGDARLLSRLVRNLMQNALRHGAPPVSAEIRRLGDGAVELAVRDHGPGVAQAERERVFEPFYRPSGRGEQAGGWGLGLSLVRQIAQRHGASVRQETPAGGGARFVVTFPGGGTA